MPLVSETCPASPCVAPVHAASTLTSIPPLTQKDKIKRCSHEGCRIKLTLVDFPCRCGKIHCPNHRLAEAHKCTFDYQADHKAHLLKYMSTPVVGKKIDVL